MQALLATLQFILHLTSSTDCQNYFECESQTISDSANCYGFGSCYSASISTEKSAFCDGAHSCHAASIDSDENILCRSVHSCISATLESASELYCEGVASCADAKIEAVNKVYSYGHYGAVSSMIIGASTVRGYGYYSLLYSTIDSGGINKMSVKLYGVDAGYNANIVCSSGSKCALICKSGACLNTDFICFDGASCSVSPEQCLNDNSVDSYDGISCPEWKVSDSKDDDDELIEYMKQKEIDKEYDIKWKLYKTYTAEDTQSFESLIQEKENDKRLDANLILAINGTNMYSYLVATIISVILIGVICAIKRSNDQYQKL